jgi:hypothetical protein
MPQCEFLFSLTYFSIPHNYLRKYSRNRMKQGPNLLFFPTRQRSPKQRRRGAPRWTHHRVVRAHPWPCSPMVWAPRASTELALPPIYCPWCKNPKGGSLHPWKVLQRHRHRRQVSRDRNICFGTLPGSGIAPGAISIDSTAIFIAVANSHDEEGVVLPQGWGCTGNHVVYLSLPWCDLYVIMSFVI